MKVSTLHAFKSQVRFKRRRLQIHAFVFSTLYAKHLCSFASLCATSQHLLSTSSTATVDRGMGIIIMCEEVTEAGNIDNQ